MKLPLLALLLLGSGALCAAIPQDLPWEPLLPDNNSFAGFRQLGGKADYEIKDGIVTGTSVPREPNSFMATEKTYGDFVLEYEFKVDPLLNSGVQIRSQSRPDHQNGRVHGYQVEIDPSERAWSAGIYDEGRRGWLNDLKGNEAARRAFKAGEWNHVRVEALGDSIKTWINGVPAADLRDAMDAEGFIALQVHGVGNDPEKVGRQVQWRHLRIAPLGRHAWQPLLPSEGLEGWSPTPGGQWTLKDGVLHGTSPAEEPQHGILVHQQPLADFTARIEFKIGSGNSGFYFRSERVQEPVALHGLQAEISASPDAGGLYETGGRGWVRQPDPKLVEKILRPDDWNELWVSAHGPRIVIHLNGQRTVDVVDSTARQSGLIGLQMHGGEKMDVQFRNVALLRPVAEAERR